MVDNTIPKVRHGATKVGRSSAVLLAVLVIAVMLTIGGFGLASADSGLGTTKDFGLTQYSSAVSPVGQISDISVDEDSHSSSETLDVSYAASAAQADLESRLAAERQAALEQEAACRNQALQAESEWLDRSDRPDGLEAVDWSVDRSAFVATWTSRIDAYLEGTSLEGYGNVFAEEAWNSGVDPRFSPAISMIESGCGAVCFLPCNAWGWGSMSWGSWEEAIADHVSGLADGYGYSLTEGAARTYCPPNCTYWYANVEYQIASI